MLAYLPFSSHRHLLLNLQTITTKSPIRPQNRINIPQPRPNFRLLYQQLPLLIQQLLLSILFRHNIPQFDGLLPLLTVIPHQQIRCLRRMQFNRLGPQLGSPLRYPLLPNLHHDLPNGRSSDLLHLDSWLPLRLQPIQTLSLKFCLP